MGFERETLISYVRLWSNIRHDCRVELNVDSKHMVELNTGSKTGDRRFFEYSSSIVFVASTRVPVWTWERWFFHHYLQFFRNSA